MTLESKSPLLVVRKWDVLYENNRSRAIDRTNWFPVPNDLSADSYVELVTHQDGPAHLGVWIALLMVASRATPRGSLLRDSRPHTAESLALLTRLPESTIKAAIERLLAIGLLEIGGDKPRKKSTLRSHSGAMKWQPYATPAQESAVEGKGKEHHHQEGNRKDRKGTERAEDQVKTDRSSAVNNAHSFLIRVDDEDNPPEVYASPEDELKAIHVAKAGEPITINVLDAIRANLESTGVSWGDFVARVRKDASNEWRNPSGLLRDLSRHFRAKTRVAARPITAAEAEARDYKCKICFSKTPGEGILQGDNGTLKPCSCASQEYIARQRERGTFPPETSQ